MLQSETIEIKINPVKIFICIKIEKKKSFYNKNFYNKGTHFELTKISIIFLFK